MISVASSLVASSEAEINAETSGIDVTITATGVGFASGEAVTVTIVSLVAGADKILDGGTANDSGAAHRDWGYTVLAEGGSGSVATGALVWYSKVLY